MEEDKLFIGNVACDCSEFEFNNTFKKKKVSCVNTHYIVSYFY